MAEKKTLTTRMDEVERRLNRIEKLLIVMVTAIGAPKVFGADASELLPAVIGLFT